MCQSYSKPKVRRFFETRCIICPIPCYSYGADKNHLNISRDKTTCSILICADNDTINSTTKLQAYRFCHIWKLADRGIVATWSKVLLHTVISFTFVRWRHMLCNSTFAVDARKWKSGWISGGKDRRMVPRISLYLPRYGN